MVGKPLFVLKKYLKNTVLMQDSHFPVIGVKYA